MPAFYKKNGTWVSVGSPANSSSMQILQGGHPRAHANAGVIRTFAWAPSYVSPRLNYPILLFQFGERRRHGAARCRRLAFLALLLLSLVISHALAVLAVAALLRL
jgi:hypothetical protein